MVGATGGFAGALAHPTAPTSSTPARTKRKFIVIKFRRQPRTYSRSGAKISKWPLCRVRADLSPQLERLDRRRVHVVPVHIDTDARAGRHGDHAVGADLDRRIDEIRDEVAFA